ncbi:MAG: LapA family protein [Hyphomicrobiaceae bacterium]|nr:LapA family protein [Hyphomicrobiaceae bacterium]
MLRRIVRLVVLLPAVVVFAALGVANSQGVRLALDPFRPDAPALSLVLPFYVWLLGALIVGVLIGGAATWVAQSHWRRSARRGDAETHRWRAEVERLNRQRQPEPSRQLIEATR